jgi:hypothetical protein
MSINTHGTIPHCESMLATSPIIFGYLIQPKLGTPYRPTNLMKDKPMELILIIVLLLLLFGGGFGFYRGGYYRQGGPVGIGGILGLVVVVLVIGWLVHGHIGGLSL